MEEFFDHRHTNLVFLFLVALCIFLLTAHLSNHVRTIKNFLFYVIVPTPYAAARVVQTGQSLSRNLQQIVAVHQDNVALRQSLEKYAFLQNEYVRMREENTRLRNLVDFPTPPKMRSVTARIVLREPGSWFQWVLINKGKRDGIPLDAPVLAWAGDSPAVLGRVGEVYENSAKVVLVTNVLSGIPAADQSTVQDGLLEGQNAPRLKLNYVLREGKIAIGDVVATSPLSSVFPPGILIGKITDIEARDNEPFQTGIIMPAVDFDNLREAVILIPARDDRKIGEQRS